MAEAGKPITDAGLTYGWHSHDFEFIAVDGVLPIDLIMQADPSISLELDLAWAHKAGQDPVSWVRKYADRLIAAHVKDVAAVGENMDEDGWADVGHGVLDWPRFWAALRQTSCKIFVMEHDNPKDDHRFAMRSLATMKTIV